MSRKKKIFYLIIFILGMSLFSPNSIWACQDAKDWGSKEFCSFLGDKDRHCSLDVDGYTFWGQKGEKVNIELKIDDRGSPSKGKASLILATQSKPFYKMDTSSLPNRISTNLPYSGKYFVLVVEQVKPLGFRGHYCLTLKSSRDAWKSFKPFSPPHGLKYPISWLPERIEESISEGMTKEIKVSFISRVDLQDMSLWVTPELKPFIKVEPNYFKKIEAHVPYEVVIDLAVPHGVKLGSYDGNIHLRHHHKTYPQTLKVELAVIDNVAPVAEAGSDQVITLALGQSSIDFELDGSNSYDPDGEIVRYIWSGVPNPADEARPRVTLFPGEYRFSLVVVDNQGKSSEPDTVFIKVLEPPNQAPIADAGLDQEISLLAGQNSVNIQLDGSASRDPDGTIVSYNWTGTPDPEDVVKPMVSLGAGTYTFTLTVTDNKGATSSPSSVRITVNPPPNQPPVANAGQNQTVNLQLGQSSAIVQLNGSGSYDPDGSIANYIWSGNPDPPDVVNPSLILPPGTYIFALVVVDDKGSTSAPSEVIVTVLPPPNLLPVANAGQNQTVSLQIGQTSTVVQLDGSGSYDPDGSIIKYTWTGLPDPADEPKPFVRLTPGTYEFTLVVTDDKNARSAPASVSITVMPPPNQRPVVSAGTNQIITFPSFASLSGTVTDDGLPIGSSLAISWSKVSGPGVVTFANPNMPVTTANFSQSGTYVLRLTASDSDLTSSSEVTIIVNQPPTANAGKNQYLTLEPGQTSIEVQLDGSGSNDPDGSIISYVWSGNPTPLPESNPKVMLAEGIYTFSLVVMDNLGASSLPSTVNIQVVKAAAPPQLLISPLEYNVNQGETLRVNISGQSPDGKIVSLSAEPALQNSTFSTTPGNPATGTFSFSPQTGQVGIHMVSFKARDSLGLMDRKAIQINVNKVNRPPILTGPDSATVDEGKMLTLQVTATDPDGDALTLSATGLPHNAIFIPATGTITFAPNYEQAGVYNIAVSASDGEVTTTKNIKITVNDVPIAPSELVLQVDPLESPTFLNILKITGTINPTGLPPEAPKIKSALITGMSPTTGEQGQTLLVKLTSQDSGDYATHFAKGVSQANFGAGITVNSVNVQSPSQIEALITISPTAPEGMRSVSVTTGGEVAVSVLAFNITKGKAKISGRLIDPDSGRAIAGAIVSIQGTNIKTTSDAEGFFNLLEVPSGKQTLLVNAQNYELLNLPIDAQVGSTIDMGTVKSRLTVFDPSAPPAVSLVSVAGRNFANVTGGQEIEDIKKVITDGILLVGGSEAGVIDEYGNQLNPQVSGSGLISLTPEGVRLIAQKMERGGETISLGELLFAFSFGLRWSQENPLSLEEWLTTLQSLVNQAWSEQNNPLHYLPILMFNRGKNISPDPPELSAFTRLNPAQAFLFTTSLWAYLLSKEQETQNANQNKTIYLASNFHVLRDVSTPLIRLAQAQPPSPPPSVSKPFTNFWRNAFASRTNVLTTNYNTAYISYLVTMNSLALPFVWSVSASAIGSVADQMRDILRNLNLANIVPEPPRANTMSSQVTTDQAGLPTVSIKFKLSPTQINDRNIDRVYIYTLYRYGNGSTERKVVDSTALTLANTNGFDLTLKDREPLPLITDSTGQVVRSPEATWFYTVTVSMLRSGIQDLSAQALEYAVPWWNQPLHKLSTPGQTLLSLPQILMSDYSVPLVVSVRSAGQIYAEEIAVNPKTGDIYLSDRMGDVIERQPRFIKISEAEGSKTFAYSGFKNPPGHKGLAIDKEGNLYTDNAASDAQFGGRIFKYYQPDGKREFVGNINYFSQMLMYAKPTAAGPMAIGPGTMAEVSEEDLYVVDELEGMVKRIMVNAPFDPYRRVGQPFANIPVAGTNVDLEVDKSGNVYLLKERIAATVLNLDMTIDKTYLGINETFKVTLTVTNPGSTPVQGVYILPLTIEGEGKVRLVKLPANLTVDLGPGETATFTYEYLAESSGYLKFAAQVQGVDASGETISSPYVRSKVDVAIARHDPLEVWIEFPDKEIPLLNVHGLMTVRLTIRSSPALKKPLTNIKFSGEPLSLSPKNKVEIQQGSPDPPIPSDLMGIPLPMSLFPGESISFDYLLMGMGRGSVELSTMVTADDPENEGKQLTATDHKKIRIMAPIFDIKVKADPDTLQLETDSEGKPIPKELSAQLTIKNIYNKPVTNISIPSSLKLSAVLGETLGYCPLTQIYPSGDDDPLIIGTLQPDESYTTSFKLRADDDGRCNVWTMVSAIDPDEPTETLAETGSTRVGVSKNILYLDIDFEKEIRMTKDGVQAGGVKKVYKGDTFLVYGTIRNLSREKKINITGIRGDILPGSYTSKIKRPFTLGKEGEESWCDGCGIEPPTLLDPGEKQYFEAEVVTINTPDSATWVELEFEVLAEAIDAEGNKENVSSGTVKRRKPVSHEDPPAIGNEMSAVDRFTYAAVESFGNAMTFPVDLIKMLWDDESKKRISKMAYDQFNFVVSWWRDVPNAEKMRLMERYMIDADQWLLQQAIDSVNNEVEMIATATVTGDYGVLAEQLGRFTGEAVADWAWGIVTCGAGKAVKSAIKGTRLRKAISEGIEAGLEEGLGPYQTFKDIKDLLKPKEIDKTKIRKYAGADPDSPKKAVQEGIINTDLSNKKPIRSKLNVYRDAEEIARLFGLSSNDVNDLSLIARLHNVKIYLRKRSEEAIKWLEEKKLAIPKSQDFKMKTVKGKIDEYLGYDKEDVGLVVFKNKKDLRLPGYEPEELNKMKLEEIMKLPKKDDSISEDLWQEILGRYEMRYEEYDKYHEKIEKMLKDKKLEMKFNYGENGLPFDDKYTGTYDFTIDEKGRLVFTKTIDEKGLPVPEKDRVRKFMTGDIDYVYFEKIDGKPLTAQEKKKLYHNLQQIGAQHGETASWDPPGAADLNEILEKRRKILDKHRQPHPEHSEWGEPLLEITGAEDVSTVHIDPNASYIDNLDEYRLVFMEAFVPAPTGK